MNDNCRCGICPVCGEATDRIIDFPLLDGSGRTEKKKIHVLCRCERELDKKIQDRMKREDDMRKIERLRSLSLMDARLKRIRFASFSITEENRKAFGIAKKYVEKFPIMLRKGQGILFYGDVGTGKSYTAAVIANELLDRMEAVIMTSFIKLVDEMGRFERNNGEEADYIQKLNRASLLIIDDLGAERGSDFALEKVYDVIDSRDRSGKPLILTTNLEFEYMKKCADIRYSRIYDRIFEMCYPVKMSGQSWRKKEAVNRFDEMKKLLEG